MIGNGYIYIKQQANHSFEYIARKILASTMPMKDIIFFSSLSLLTSLSLEAQKQSINEERFLPIGGIEQWVTIEGADKSKPVILFLHGGPGSVMTPYVDNIYGAWREDFILVNWDQRGAGRTFGRNAPMEVNEDYWVEYPLTIEQMVTDGIELSEYLIDHLGKQKIIILATSWGSVLGVEMTLRRPDLFYGYIGHSQVVNSSESLMHAYNKILKMTQDASDQEATDKIRAIGPPPYDDAKNAGQLFQIIKKYEREHSTTAPDSWWQPAPQYDNEVDAKNRYDGDDYSFINYVGHKKLGIKAMNTTIDFMKDVNFKVPVYLIQGENDILTPKELTKAYFYKINAPKKDFFLVPGAAHGHNQAVVDTQIKILQTFFSD